MFVVKDTVLNNRPYGGGIEMAKSRIAARLARRWRARPETQVRAIIRTIADVDETAAILEQRGLKVTRRYHLLPAVAVAGSAQDILALSDEDWITSIEEDQQIHSMQP
jgi:hypothetical protein